MAEPTKRIEETPEFKAAVAAAAREAAEAVRAEIRAEMAKAAPAMSADMNWISALAMEISQLTDQGTGRRRVAPEIMRQRAEAHNRMVGLIDQAAARRHDLLRQASEASADERDGLLRQAATWMPTYRLRNKVHLDEQLVDPVWIDKSHVAQPTTIEWPSMPNDAMVPVNAVARDIHAAFMDSVGSVAKQDQVLQQPLKATRGGLVVKGAPSRARHETTLEQVEANMSAQGLRVNHKDEAGGARMKEVRVLGTIAKPAQQSY